MNIDNIFELLVAVVFSTSPQLGELGPKYQDLVISFGLGVGETLQQFHLISLQERSEFFLLNDEKGQAKKSQVNTSWKFQNLNTYNYT